MKFKKVVFYNSNSNVPDYLKISRKKFEVIKVVFDKEDDKLKAEIYRSAQNLAENTHDGAANSSNQREYNTKLKDALAGEISEKVSITLINKNFGEGTANSTSFTTANGQIDIKLSNNKTIEVRSSCIRNGIDFALFSKNKYKLDEQYVDILGPYSNSYKPDEIKKNYYLRVLYHCDKDNFLNYFNSDNFAAYIVGGATWDMMGNEELYQIKNLIPEGAAVRNKTNYRVIPIGKALDIMQLLEKVKQEL